MPNLAEIDDLISLVDTIDEISTRLIIDGANSVTAADFHSLGQSAAEEGLGDAADIARRIEESIATPGLQSIPDRTRLLSLGLMEIREALGQRTHSGNDSVAGLAQPQAGPLSADSDLVREFITEAKEHLVAIEGHMLALEKDAKSAEPLNAVFRAFHTIKGLAGLLEFAGIQSVAHEVETLLDRARNGQLEITSLIVDVILESADVVSKEMAAIEQRLDGETPGPSSIDNGLLQRIRSATVGGRTSSDIVTAAATVAAPLELSVTLAKAAFPQALVTSEPSLVPAKAAAESSKPADSTSVRIDTAKLDQLMDMVGEMVIAQTLISHSPILATVKDPRLVSDLTQLARITADVQRITTGMRMVPIGLQFQKTARMIRDLSRRAGKQIVFETSGEDTELDKSIAEELSDPLLHMVRNSVDHGIETPAERTAANKDPTAHIRVSAYHQSGQIVIAISDDGRGLNREKILAKAKQNGLIHGGTTLSENEIFQLIFEPGFSTAEKVTDISGRGVGMDVVRRHGQKMRGRIDIQSKAGEGTTFYLKLPLTLAIIEGLVVVVGAHRYIVPIFAVKEMFRPTPEMVSTVQGSHEMVLVRGGYCPSLGYTRGLISNLGRRSFLKGYLSWPKAKGASSAYSSTT
jgi:two-component system chemotaxis sensor kinase CheA